MTGFAGVAFGLLMVCQINAPSLHRQVSVPCEQAGLAACVVMGPRKVKAENARNEGFTLIEMSIVLVIIGLVVGGVLVGQDLINAATMRSQVTQLEQFSSAVNTYQLKYGYLPGDDPNATANGLGFSGNGDGIITMFHGPLTGYAWEGLNAWNNLSLAGLLPGNYVTYQSLNACTPGLVFPLTKLSAYSKAVSAPSGFGLFTADYSGFDSDGTNAYQYLGDGRIWVALMSGSGSTCWGIARGGISSKLLYQLDTKIDDGIPFTGRIRLMGQDGSAGDPSFQSMCNGNPAPYGRNCNFQNPAPGTCATGTVGSAGTYTITDNTTCPFAYRLQ